jgi:putative acetyltransferase
MPAVDAVARPPMGVSFREAGRSVSPLVAPVPSVQSSNPGPQVMSNEPISIRRLEPSDIPFLRTLFFETVHTVNAADYSPDQLDAWAPFGYDEDEWARSFVDKLCLVAEMDGDVVGFVDMDMGRGYLDRLYVSSAHQRMGIATMLMRRLLESCRTRGVVDLTVDASITARPFFERFGFSVERAQSIERNGVELTNYRMTADGRIHSA